MKRIIKYLFLFVAMTTFFACSSDDNGDAVFSGADITAFSITGYESSQAEINATDHTIFLQLPATVKYGNELCPIFTLSEGATASVREEEQVSGSSTVNFTRVVTYTVTAENGTQTDWKVTVTNNDYSVEWGLGHFISDEYTGNGKSPDGFYLQQQHTGEYSNNNCGPTCAVMAARWADPSYSGTVEEARNHILYSQYSTDDPTDLSWHPQDVEDYLVDYGFDAVIETLPSVESQFVTFVTDRLKEGKLMVICLNMSYVTQAASGANIRINKYYNGTNGHFLVIKGYKIVDGVVWMEINDPWGLDLKYTDGTYYGNNRYYRAGELARTYNWNSRVVVVSR